MFILVQGTSFGKIISLPNMDDSPASTLPLLPLSTKFTTNSELPIKDINMNKVNISTNGSPKLLSHNTKCVKFLIVDYLAAVEPL